MRHYETHEHVRQSAGKGPFVAQSTALDPVVYVKMGSIFVLAVLTILMASLIGMNVSNASQGGGLSAYSHQAFAITKTDRVGMGVSGGTCDQQAWGAWSAECAAALSGAKKVRNVSFVTVEQTPRTVNETILARFPTTYQSIGRFD